MTQHVLFSGSTCAANPINYDTSLAPSLPLARQYALIRHLAQEENAKGRGNLSVPPWFDTLLEATTEIKQKAGTATVETPMRSGRRPFFL
jgi:hypothetical protein